MAEVPLTFGCKVIWQALDPVTDAPVAGVIIENATLYGYDLSPGVGSTTLTDITPLLTPENLDEQAG